MSVQVPFTIVGGDVITVERNQLPPKELNS